MDMDPNAEFALHFSDIQTKPNVTYVPSFMLSSLEHCAVVTISKHFLVVVR